MVRKTSLTSRVDIETRLWWTKGRTYYVECALNIANTVFESKMLHGLGEQMINAAWVRISSGNDYING